jgi:phage shock protein C
LSTNASGAPRLHRSRHDRMVAGVCGGLAEYRGLDPTVVRFAAAGR